MGQSTNTAQPLDNENSKESTGGKYFYGLILELLLIILILLVLTWILLVIAGKF